MNTLFIGIDIQVRRDCSYAVIDNGGMLVESGWLSNPIGTLMPSIMAFDQKKDTRLSQNFI